MDGLWTEVCGQQKQPNNPGNNQHIPQSTNYWATLTRKRHIPPHSAQPQHTNDWAPRTRKRHQQEHRPQRPTERSDPTQHAKGRTGDRPGPRKGATTRRNVTRGGGGGQGPKKVVDVPKTDLQFRASLIHFTLFFLQETLSDVGGLGGGGRAAELGLAPPPPPPAR